MDEARRNRDFSKGPVWNPERNRWLVEIRYPDGSRLRKRLRREREALRIWSAEQTKIENGTWHDQAPKTVTFDDGAEAVSRILEGPESLTRLVRRTCALRVGSTHQSEDAAGEDHARSNRRVSN